MTLLVLHYSSCLTNMAIIYSQVKEKRPKGRGQCVLARSLFNDVCSDADQENEKSSVIPTMKRKSRNLGSQLRRSYLPRSNCEHVLLGWDYFTLLLILLILNLERETRLLEKSPRPRITSLRAANQNRPAPHPQKRQLIL